MSLSLLLGITELSYTNFKMTSSCNWNLQFVQLILDFMYCSDNFGSILLWKSCCLLFQFLFIWNSLSLAWMLNASKRTLWRAAAAMRIKKLTYNGNWTQRSRWSVMWWRWCLLFSKWRYRLNDGIRSQHLPGSRMDSGLVGEKTLDASWKKNDPCSKLPKKCLIE